MTDDFVVYAVDFELCDLRDSLRRAAGKQQFAHWSAPGSCLVRPELAERRRRVSLLRADEVGERAPAWGRAPTQKKRRKPAARPTLSSENPSSDSSSPDREIVLVPVR